MVVFALRAVNPVSDIACGDTMSISTLLKSHFEGAISADFPERQPNGRSCLEIQAGVLRYPVLDMTPSRRGLLTSPMTVSWLVNSGCFSGSGPLPLTVAYGSGRPLAVRKSTWMVALAPASPPMLPNTLSCEHESIVFRGLAGARFVKSTYCLEVRGRGGGGGWNTGEFEE